MLFRSFSFFSIRRIFADYRWGILLAIAFLVRFYHLDWGEGLFFHPDENNMARSVSQMSFPDIDPRFFAYGQFPLYLAYFTGILINSFKLGFTTVVAFSEAVYLLRFWSAVFSLATVVIGYRLATVLFPDKKQRYIYPALLALTPGLIQSAHFGTTESILAFVFIALAYFCLKIFRKEAENKHFLMVGFLGGIGLATKMSAIVYIFPLLLVTVVINVANSEKKLIGARNSLFLFLITGLFFALFCPFYFIRWQEALTTVVYESRVAVGEAVVFYTRQFTNTGPVIFQLTKIFPWVLGLPMFLLFLAGLITGVGRLLFRRMRLKKGLVIVLIGPVFWFMFNGFLYAKWVRFMIPILPFFVLLAAWFVSLIERKKVKTYFLLAVLFPGLIFLKVYKTDVRLFATDWMNEKLPAGSVILSEGGNIIDLPVENRSSFKVTNFDFYSLEDSLENKEELDELVSKADYILIPSRRVFANLSKNNKKYPQTRDYYQKLFSGELGFIGEKEFRTFSLWEELLLGSDLTSEETWTVFDRPTIRLYKRELI